MISRMEPAQVLASAAAIMGVSIASGGSARSSREKATICCAWLGPARTSSGAPPTSRTFSSLALT